MITTHVPTCNKNNWYDIIERTGIELSFYTKQGLVPSLRKMYYRLIELGVLEKSESNYNHFSEHTASARRGIKRDYITPSGFPKLPIDCFRDDTRQTIGRWEASCPSDPTPDIAPDDAMEVTQRAIQDCKNAILNYTGACTAGDEGVMPDRWYMQPVYPVILCEYDTIQPDLLKFQRDRGVRVGSVGGQTSTGYIYNFCRELYEIATNHDWIEEIVVLYFGDSDKSGGNIRRNIERILEWYQGESDEFTIPVPVTLRLIAITPEQVERYHLKGYQLEAFMTTEHRLKVFKKTVLDAIDECWDGDIYEENCPDKEYDYEANGEERPKDIDPDNTFYEDTEITIRKKMAMTVTVAFKPGWDKEGRTN